MRAPAPADQPELSVVVVAYNCRDLALACIESLDRERRDLELEVVLVDNSSTDGTASAVRERYSWVRLLDGSGNVGFSRANNLALREARGRHLLLLNPDTVVSRGALKGAVGALEADPQLGMLGCKLVRPDGSLDHACKRGFPTLFGALCYFTGLSRLRPRSPLLSSYTAGHIHEDETAFVDAVNGAFMLARWEAVEAVGGLDEDFWMYGEDLDWCRRFWQAGWPVLYWPQVTVTHVKGGSSGKYRTWRTNYEFHRGMWLFYRKHARGGRKVLAPFVWAAIQLKFALSAARSLLALRLLQPRVDQS